MKLICYVRDGDTVDIQPSPATRDWMDATPQRFAYRCLPMTIANAHGWEIRCATGFEASWNGGAELSDIRIDVSGGAPAPAISHFGSGILTFHVPCVLRTPEGFNLWISGPPNRYKDGIAALSGVIESDWSVASFTMNWKFTRPNHPVRFAAGEPYCFLFPVERNCVERVEPEMRPLEDDPGLERGHWTWLTSRQAFNEKLYSGDEQTIAEGWQRDYHQGRYPDGSPAKKSHQSRLRPRPFAPIKGDAKD